MRVLLLSLLLAACSNDSDSPIDASIKVVDAAVDAPPDAPPDGPSMNIVTACMHACDAVAVCAGEPPNAACYTQCQQDLLDCTADQVAAIDACSTQECGDEESSPLIDCFRAVRCIDS